MRDWLLSACCHVHICVFHFSLSGSVWAAGAAGSRSGIRDRIYTHTQDWECFNIIYYQRNCIVLLCKILTRILSRCKTNKISYCFRRTCILFAIFILISKDQIVHCNACVSVRHQITNMQSSVSAFEVGVLSCLSAVNEHNGVNSW